MVRGTGSTGVTGDALARAMPRALKVNIREALDMLEEETKLMGDGPNLGLKGVTTVYEIVTDGMVPQGQPEGVSKSGKMHAGRPLVREEGLQGAIYGEHCTVEWGKQKRGKVRGDAGNTEGEGRGSGSAEAANKEMSTSGGYFPCPAN